MNHRFRFILFVIATVGAFGYLGVHMYDLQIRQGQYYSVKAESQYRLAGLLAPRRGSIFFTDKNGTKIPAATHKDYPVVFAVPQEIDDIEEAVQALAPLLEMAPEHLRSRLERKSSYEPLVRKADAQRVDRVYELGLRGIYFDTQELRYYPFGQVAAHLIGFVGPGDEGDQLIGKYGLELFYEDRLAGQPGVLRDRKLPVLFRGRILRLLLTVIFKRVRKRYFAQRLRNSAR
jgi:stage V sporulation protein D (sporulation-specific penicillin-binding protein)